MPFLLAAEIDVAGTRTSYVINDVVEEVTYKLEIRSNSSMQQSNPTVLSLKVKPHCK